MSTEILTIIIVCLLVFFLIIIAFCCKILKKQKQQELIQLVNDISYEISKRDFQSVKYTLGKPKSNGICELQQTVYFNREVFTNYNDYNFQYKGFIIEINSRGKEIFVKGFYGIFTYCKTITIIN